MKAALPEPEIVTKNGKPVSVILPIKRYQEIMERLEDAEDVAWLKKARRLRPSAVVRAEPFGSNAGLVMLDFDTDGNVVGIEVVGQQEFSIRELIKNLPVQTTDALLERTRYVAADLQPA